MESEVLDHTKPSNAMLLDLVVVVGGGAGVVVKAVDRGRLC